MYVADRCRISALLLGFVLLRPTPSRAQDAPVPLDLTRVLELTVDDQIWCDGDFRLQFTLTNRSDAPVALPAQPDDACGLAAGREWGAGHFVSFSSKQRGFFRMGGGERWPSATRVLHPGEGAPFWIGLTGGAFPAGRFSLSLSLDSARHGTNEKTAPKLELEFEVDVERVTATCVVARPR
jgi:hypothetical protein